MTIYINSLADADALIESMNRKDSEPILPRAKNCWLQWEHQGWGDSICWNDFSNGRLYGHIGFPRNKIMPGDEIRTKMLSGSTTVSRITEVEYTQNVKDMFFAKAEHIDYLENIDKDFDDYWGLSGYQKFTMRLKKFLKEKGNKWKF